MSLFSSVLNFLDDTLHILRLIEYLVIDLRKSSVPLSRSVCRVRGEMFRYRHTSWLSIHLCSVLSFSRLQISMTRCSKYSNLRTNSSNSCFSIPFVDWCLFFSRCLRQRKAIYSERQWFPPNWQHVALIILVMRPLSYPFLQIFLYSGTPSNNELQNKRSMNLIQ